MRCHDKIRSSACGQRMCETKLHAQFANQFTLIFSLSNPPFSILGIVKNLGPFRSLCFSASRCTKLCICSTHILHKPVWLCKLIWFLEGNGTTYWFVMVKVRIVIYFIDFYPVFFRRISSQSSTHSIKLSSIQQHEIEPYAIM